MRDVPWWVLGMFAMFYAIGLGLLTFGLLSARRSTMAGRWPTAAGTLTACEWVPPDGDGDVDGDGGGGGGEDGRGHRVKVAYTYTVGDHTYTGERLAFGYSGDAGYVAQRQAYNRLRAAKAVTVRYDPADPATATLSFGLHRSIQFTLIFATMWLGVVGGVSLLLWLNKQPNDVLLRNLVTR